MTNTDIIVQIQAPEFTVGELQEFLDTVRATDGMSSNALVFVENDDGDFRLYAGTGYRHAT